MACSIIIVTCFLPCDFLLFNFPTNTAGKFTSLSDGRTSPNLNFFLFDSPSHTFFSFSEKLAMQLLNQNSLYMLLLHLKSNNAHPKVSLSDTSSFFLEYRTTSQTLSSCIIHSLSDVKKRLLAVVFIILLFHL